MPYDGFDVHTNTWSTSSTTTGAGKTNNDNLVNDIFTSLGNFVNELSPIFFLSSIQNFQSAIENFGYGMSGVLACVSLDLQVVSSGLSSAAIAYAATDTNIATTFAQLNTQLAYYTNTATSANTLAQPSAADQAALNTAYQQYTHPATSSSGPDVGKILIGAAIVVAVVVVVIVAAPVVAAAAATIGVGEGLLALGAAILAF